MLPRGRGSSPGVDAPGPWQALQPPAWLPSTKRPRDAYPDPGGKRGPRARWRCLHDLCQICLLTQLFLLEPWGC